VNYALTSWFLGELDQPRPPTAYCYWL
jgi:hypothetical protein